MSFENLVVVAFGDSITEGLGFPAGFDNWTNIVEKRYGMKLINAGVGGNTSLQGIMRMDEDVLSHKPDHVLINFGMNDHVMEERNKPQVNKEIYTENLTNMVKRIKEIGANPILTTPNYIIEGDASKYYYSRHAAEFYYDVKGAQAWLDGYADIVRTVSEETGASLIDLRLECEKYDRYDFLRSLKNSDAADGTHLSAIGAVVYAQMVCGYFDRL